jgi:hypothetical protein
MLSFSTSDLLVRNSRISFAKVAPEVASREERFIIANDNEGYIVHFGTSTLISTVNGDTLKELNPSRAAFSFDVRSKALGIGGVPNPQFTIDISSSTGIRIQGGGRFTGDARGLVSVPTASLFSTLPTAIFAQRSIPIESLISTNNATLYGISVPTSSLFGYLNTSLYGPSTIPLLALKGSGLLQADFFRGDGSLLSNIPLGAINADITGNFFKPNSIPAYALPSTGNLWIRDISGFLAAPFVSTGTLTATFISSVTSISVGTVYSDQIETSTLILKGVFNVASISTGTLTAGNIVAANNIQAASFIGDGSQITNIDPAKLLTTIPSNKFGFETIPFDALNPYGDFRVLGGSVYVNGPVTTTGTTTSAYFVGDGSQLTNIPFGPALASTVAGLGTAGYFSTATGGGEVTRANLVSTVVGLGTAGYISTLSGSGDVTKENLVSTVVGLGTAGYISTLSAGDVTKENLVSTVVGLGTVGYISTLSAGDVTKENLVSTVVGLGTVGYISTPGNTIYNDAWIQSNLINPPPAIVFGTPASQSSEIFVPWTYPTQLNVGFQNSWLPVINSLNVLISTQLTSINPSTIISTLSTGYVDYHNGLNYITGAVITNTVQATGIQLKTFPQDGIPRYAFVFYSPTLSGLNKDGQLIAFYNNYNVGSNVASTIFSPFLAAGPPSVPRKLQSTNVTFETLSFYFSTPQFVDTLNPTSVATISRYDISFNSVPIPGVRYGTAIYDAQTAVKTSPFTFVASPDSTAGNVIKYDATTLFPDSKYDFYVKATNSASIAGPFASTLGISTSYLTPNSGITVQFPSRFFTGTINRVLAGLSNITTLLNTNTDYTSSNFVVPLHNITNRGTIATGIATLATSVSGAISVTGPTVTFNGFPATLASGATLSNLTVTPTAVYDKYTTPARYTGFYLNASNTVTIRQATFSTSQTQYTHTTTLVQSGTTTTSQFNFYYDGLLGTATILDMAFNFSVATPPTATYVSGVNVISGQPTLSTITGASNLGKFFFKSPILSYTNTTGSVTTSFSETTVSNIISGVSDGQISQSQRIGFSNGSFQLNSLATAYALSTSMTVTAANASNTSAAFLATPLQCVIDGPSVTLINTTLPASPLTLSSNVAERGCRIWSYSNYDATTFVPPYIYSLGAGSNYSFTNFLYTAATTHTSSIVDATLGHPLITELQVTNGAHRSKGTRTDCYIDYRIKKYSATLFNTVNYSSVTTSGVRFATFAWKIAAQSTNYSVLRFTLTYVSADSDAISVVNNLIVFTGTADKIYVFYRVEDQSSILPTNGSSASTVWLDANGTIANSATALTYYVDSTGTYQQIYGGVTSGATLASPTIIFPSLFIPSFSTESPKDIRIICKIGIPMNRNFAFTQVTATLS